MIPTQTASWRDQVFAELDHAGLTSDDLGDIPLAPPTPVTDPFAPVRCPACNTAPVHPVTGGWECGCGALLLRSASVPPL